VIGNSDGSITIRDLVDGRGNRRLPAATRFSFLQVHPRGDQFAVACNQKVEVRDLASGQVVASLPLPVDPHVVVWHPDGRTLAILGLDARIYLWDMMAGQEIRILDGLRSAGIAIAFNHSGSLLASTGWEGKLRLWDFQTGRQLFSTTSRAAGGYPRFSPDDRYVSVDIRGSSLGLWEISACPEYQTLIRTAAPMQGPDYYASIHRDGRLLAVGMTGGVGLWDLANGRELTFLELPGIQTATFEPSGALLTNGASGLMRWPVEIDAEKVRIAPSRKLSMPGSRFNVSSSADGGVIASAHLRGALVLHEDRPDRLIALAPHIDARYTAVSPDGKLVATGSHMNVEVRVWEAAGGKLLTVLPGVGWGVSFSPDGKWLGTVAGGHRLWEVGTWREGPKIGGDGTGTAFSPDSKILAVETGFGVIRLVDPESGGEYARLEDPNLDRATCIRFSPDGTQLIATNDDSQSIHVWDLRAIRKELVRMNLDWSLPPYPEGERSKKPLQVVIDPG
jgi:WD40 repeat protein